MNLEERHIPTQIYSFINIDKRTMYEYNILVCQVSSEPLGGTDLETESGVNT